MESLSPEALQYLPNTAFAGIVFLAFFIGACIGSFLNVVIYRLPIMLQKQWQEESTAFLGLPEDNNSPAAAFNLAVPRSSCPNCSAPIRAWQNIPVISYVLLKGKCQQCKAPISLRYPMVETITALITVMLILIYGLQPQTFALILFTYVCIALTGIDIDHQLLPDNLTLPLLWLGLLVNTQWMFASLSSAVWGAVLGYGVLWLVFWIFKLTTGKEGMGYGDFKLMAVFGAWFGWPILPNTILMSSLIGAVIGGLTIWRKGHSMQTPIPYGPFIIVAGWLSAMFPQYFTLFDYL